MKLNAAQLAALATGASPEVIAALATAPEANPAGNPAAADPAAAPGADDAAAVAATAAAAAGAATPTAPPAGEGIGGAAPAAAAAAAPAVQDNSAIVAHLTGQLTEANAALIAAKVEAETFKAQAVAVDGLVTTLRAALGEKLVALGGSADAAAGHTAATIAAEYSRVDAVFKTQFRVGGVAAVASPDEKETKASIDPMLDEAFKHSLIK